MGDKGEGSQGQLLRLPDPGFHHQGRQPQRGGGLRAFQEPRAYGVILSLYTSSSLAASQLLILIPVTCTIHECNNTKFVQCSIY